MSLMPGGHKSSDTAEIFSPVHDSEENLTNRQIISKFAVLWQRKQLFDKTRQIIMSLYGQ